MLYVDPPVSHATGYRHKSRAAPSVPDRLETVAARITRLRPVVLPFPRRAGMSELTSRLVARLVRQALVRSGDRAIALVDSDPLAPVLGRVPAPLQVYWAQDDFEGGAALLGQSARRLRRGDVRQARRADLVIASSPVVEQRLRAQGYRPILVPFGCDSRLFAGVDETSPAPDVLLTGPVAGFVGYLGDRIDLRLLDAVAQRGHSLLLVGPLHPRFDPTRLGPLLSRPNVQWVGARQFAELPSYLRRIDVGLVPYADTAFNRGSFPLKTLEYLAAGRPVVATDLPSTRWLDTDLVHLQNEPAAFADAVTGALAAGRVPELVAARRTFAERHDWQHRADDFIRVLGLLGPRAAGPPDD